MIPFTDNDLCGHCSAHFDTEKHAPDCPNRTVKAEGEPITFTPTDKRGLGVSGIVQTVINNGFGQRGYQIFTPTANDPTRVLRVWERDGEIT